MKKRRKTRNISVEHALPEEPCVPFMVATIVMAVLAISTMTYQSINIIGALFIDNNPSYMKYK